MCVYREVVREGLQVVWCDVPEAVERGSQRLQVEEPFQGRGYVGQGSGGEADLWGVWGF